MRRLSSYGRRDKKKNVPYSEAWSTHNNALFEAYRQYESQGYKKNKLNIFKKGIFQNYEDKPKKTKIQLKVQENYFKSGVTFLCQNGSLHGLKYMVEKSLALIERLVWLIICVGSIAVCGYYIYGMVNNFLSVPFNLVIDKIYTPIYDIPFPAVVICPENTVKYSFINLENTTDKELLFAASLICSNMVPENYSLPEGVGPELDEKILQFFNNTSPTCHEMIGSCKWNSGGDTNTDCCNSLFETFLTSNGVCFGFNTAFQFNEDTIKNINKHHEINFWDPEDGYDFALNNSMTYPRRSFSVGDGFGLSVNLNFNKTDSQYICTGADSGFKVFIGFPVENALVQKYVSLPLNKETTFLISPFKIKTETKMKNIDANIRKCYFDDERVLKYFHYYTEDNCIKECELIYILKYCNCVPFYFKSIIPNASICKVYKQYICINSVKEKVNFMSIASYYSENKKSTFDEKLLSKDYNNGMENCNCYPRCISISYNTESFYSDIVKLHDNTPNNVSQGGNEVTRIDVTFKTTLFLGLHRQMQYDTMDFIAAIGGLLSLFLGFSIISLIEIAYFVIIRPSFVSFFKKIYNNRVNPYLP